MTVRVLAWFMYRGHAILQAVGLAAVAVACGFLFSWPVGLAVGGIELTALGALLEAKRVKDARSTS